MSDDDSDLKDEEETPKESAVSDSLVDAFDDEAAPVSDVVSLDALAEEEENKFANEENEDDELDSGDYKPNDEW